MTKLTDIQGIGEVTAKLLHAHGFKTVNGVAKAGAKRIAELPGFSETRAKLVVTSAISLVKETPVKEKAKPAKKPKKDKKKKKDKKSKKDKKKKKKKSKKKGKKKK